MSSPRGRGGNACYGDNCRSKICGPRHSRKGNSRSLVWVRPLHRLHGSKADVVPRSLGFLLAIQDVIMRKIARQGEGADRPFRVRFDQ
jgi:hypothetical protein